MGFSPAEQHAMRRALELASTPGVPLGPNPRVGCVLLDPDGERGRRGLPPRRRHAARRGRRAGRGRRGRPRRDRGGHPRAVPPHRPHRAVLAGADRGRGAAGSSSPSPTPTRSRPGARRRCAPPASQVEFGLLEREARALNRAWTFAMEHHRPFVTWKFATTLDGRSAAADGSSRWVTSRAARVDSHRLRAQCDVMLVGTGTVEVDDPELTVRDEYDDLLPHQPLRAVMGLRDLDPDRRVLNDRAETVRLRDPRPARGAGRAARAGPAARLPRGRTPPGGRVPAGRAGRRGRRLRRARAARRRAPARSATWASDASPTRSGCRSPT